MNHLKHIRGISVRASSNAALPSHYGQQADVYFENHQLKSHCQLLRSDPLFAAKKSHGVDAKYLTQFRQDSLRLVSKDSKTIYKQRCKTKSSVTSLKKKSSMHKKSPSVNIAKRVCHYSTCQNAKFTSNGINKQLMAQSDAIINGAKNTNRHSSFIGSVEKHPRSYADMIADYSESLYKESIVGARNDGFPFNNAIRKSPFSTFLTPPPVKKIVNVAEYSELSTERQKNDSPLPVKSFELCNRHNNINTVECYNFQHHGTSTADAMNKNINRSCVTTNDLRSDDQSYAQLVADCSNSMNNIPITSVLNDGLVPKRNVLARSTFESVTTPRKASGTNTQETSQTITPTVSTMPLEKRIKEQVINLKKSDWLREMENVMSDMKRVTERKDTRVVDILKMKKSDAMLPVDASSNSLDRNRGLTEFIKSNKQKEDSAIRKTCQSDKIDRIEKRKKDFELQKHNYSHLSDKTSNIPQYFDNAAESSAVRKNSTHVSTSGNTGVLKQPQVKLRMVPSEKESVVSINVDQASSIALSDPLNSASKHLSVVVQSDQKEELMDNQWNTSTLRRTTKSTSQRSDFGSMRISISEDSAPVKQIEFSINGKPVSELKSITARTESLDVVSSVNKIEIRIPFVKDDSNTLGTSKENDISKEINSNKGQILNVQISANFQDEPTKGNSVEKPAKPIQYQHDKDMISKSPLPISPYSFNNFPKTQGSTLSNINIQQYNNTIEASKRMNIKLDESEKNMNEYKISGDINFNIQRKTMKDLSAGKTGISSIKEVNNVEVESLNMRKVNISESPETNTYDKNETSDTRVPSKMIPWWSSSDSFNKIRKKQEEHKPLIPPSNRNEQKTVSNLNQNLVTKSSLSKPKETSNLKMKKTGTINNATVTTSDSGNISYSNSMKPREESKPTHYASSFRLKQNQENHSIIPEIVRNGLKAEDNQTLTAKKDINNIFGIKQTESIRSDTMNMKDKRDISIKEKTSVLRRKIKTPSSAQNLSPRNQENKNNYSLKQTRSIDDVSKNIKSKIKDILDAIKPIERKEDGTLVDYNLKNEMSSREPTVKLNSGVKEVQDSSPATTIKDLISNLSTAEVISKKIDKTMLTRQTESTNTTELKTKMDILLKEKDLTAKKDAPVDIKESNQNDVKNRKDGHDFMTSSSFRNSPELMQTFKKQEQLADNIIVFQDKLKENLKSLQANENRPNSLLNTRSSSGTMQKSEKIGISAKVPSEESKQNRSKGLTSTTNIPEMLQESEKFRTLTSSKLANLSKESLDTTMINKSSLEAIKPIQSKSKNINTNKMADIKKLSSSQTMSNSTSRIKNHAASKNLTNKNTEEMSIIQSVKPKRTDTGDIIAKIITQNPKSKDSLLKDSEENYFKSRLGRGSAGSSRKPNDSIGFKSADSKTKSRSPTFKVRRNLRDADMLEHPAPTAIASDGQWINMDRPEKSILYSAWLQRSENDIKKKEK